MNSIEPILPFRVKASLAVYRSKIKTFDCLSCKADLSKAPISFYPHALGWKLWGLKFRQWLFIRCTHCGYDIALWKLGVQRPDDIERIEISSC